MRIIIVEDHQIMREAIRLACQHGGRNEVIAEVESGQSAIKLAVQHRPDLVILDLGLPDIDGFTVASTILRNLPGTRFLVLTASLDEYTLFRVKNSTLHGFLDKGSGTIVQLALALDRLASGQRYFSPAYQAARGVIQANPTSFEKILSGSEQQVLSLVGEGLTDEEIGSRLGIAPTTAQTHRRNLLQKLSLKGSPKLVAYAINRGFTRVASRSPFPGVAKYGQAADGDVG